METHYVNGTGVPSKTSIDGKRVFQLRVRSVKMNETFMVRTLHDTYCGLFTHYYRNRSKFCGGENCNVLYHKLDRIWKGYASVEMWNGDTQKWFPIVLEMTEHMELDFRGLWKRGQIWEIYNFGMIDGRASPSQAKLHEDLGGMPLPLPHDIVPVLQTLYHTPQLNLSSKNPLPPRVIVTESEGPPPKLLEVAPAAKMPTPEEYAELKRQRDEMMNKSKRTLQEKTNGKPR